MVFVKNHYYHVFNRGFRKKSIFDLQGSPTRVLSLLNYYRFKNHPTSYSLFLKLTPKLRSAMLQKMEKRKNFLVDIVAFCLMPNHFHLLLKERGGNGIRQFTSKVQNGYAKYFNTKNKRTGPVFQGRFQAVLIKSDYQLLHLSRYLHLNPYSAKIVKSLPALLDYHWSSLPQYLDQEKGFCQPEIVLKQFKNRSDYKKFLLDRADYQKNLESIKHLALDQNP